MLRQQFSHYGRFGEFLSHKFGMNFDSTVCIFIQIFYILASMCLQFMDHEQNLRILVHCESGRTVPSGERTEKFIESLAKRSKYVAYIS